MMARRFPFCAIWCISGREATVSAVSDPEKKCREKEEEKDRSSSDDHDVAPKPTGD
jgi:hypothetical protein